MEARLIYSKFWTDNFIIQLTVPEKLLFIYLLTNQFVNIIDFYECSDRQIIFDTGITQKVLDIFKVKLTDSGKILFYKDYVFIRNAKKYQTFKGEKNDIKRAKILDKMPTDVLGWYNKVLDTPIDTPIDRVPIGSYNPYIITNNKYLITNNKEEIINKSFNKIEDITNPVLEEIAEKYEVSVGFVENCWDTAQNWLESSGKTKKNYKAFLSNWVKSEKGKEVQNGKPRAIDAERIIRERKMGSQSEQRSLHS